MNSFTLQAVQEKGGEGRGRGAKVGRKGVDEKLPIHTIIMNGMLDVVCSCYGHCIKTQ